MTERFLLRLRHDGEVVAEAPLVVHDKERALAVLDAVKAPWTAVTLQGVRGLIDASEELKTVVGIELSWLKEESE